VEGRGKVGMKSEDGTEDQEAGNDRQEVHTGKERKLQGAGQEDEGVRSAGPSFITPWPKSPALNHFNPVIQRLPIL
jgi:hypothetical protein